MLEHNFCIIRIGILNRSFRRQNSKSDFTNKIKYVSDKDFGVYGQDMTSNAKLHN